MVNYVLETIVTHIIPREGVFIFLQNCIFYNMHTTLYHPAIIIFFWLQ